MDLLYIEQGDNQMYAHLAVMWGLIADVDIQSEKYRWMGSARFTAAAVARLLFQRKYYGTLWYLPSQNKNGEDHVK